MGYSELTVTAADGYSSVGERVAEVGCGPLAVDVLHCAERVGLGGRQQGIGIFKHRTGLKHKRIAAVDTA